MGKYQKKSAKRLTTRLKAFTEIPGIPGPRLNSKITGHAHAYHKPGSMKKIH